MKQCVRRHADASQNTATQILPVRTKGIHCGRRTKVQHHQGLTVLLHRCHTGYRTVRTQAVISLITNPGGNIFVDDDRLFPKVFDDGTGQSIHHLRNHRGNDNVGDLIHGQIKPTEVFAHRQADLV